MTAPPGRTRPADEPDGTITPHASVRGTDGRDYQIEIEAEWDDQPGGAVRVVGAIDDGSFRTFLPLSAEFIVAPDGSLFRPPR